MSEFLRMRLHVVVAEELKLRSGRSIPECLTAAFLRADAEARKKKNRDGEPMPSGSTAVTCLVKKSGGSKYLYCANCGDARAVLCKGETAVRLSTVSFEATLCPPLYILCFPVCGRFTSQPLLLLSGSHGCKRPRGPARKRCGRIRHPQPSPWCSSCLEKFR